MSSKDILVEFANLRLDIDQHRYGGGITCTRQGQTAIIFIIDDGGQLPGIARA